MKKPDISRPVFQIFPEKKILVMEGRCTMDHCKRVIREEDFRDELSKKEYSILGMCQKCQDEIFINTGVE